MIDMFGRRCNINNVDDSRRYEKTIADDSRRYNINNVDGGQRYEKMIADDVIIYFINDDRAMRTLEFIIF
ncbi:MAG: hypothetical protein E6845_19470 [Clostridium sp.]|uniref:hypothetical protein n=1 Tax=Clostridium TaxID=1485 RepID=UPI0028FED202|nr:hypothetical protein [Clostridium sp.]MDU1605140.1 hypothetical protein [Clostridium sp.]